MSLSQACRACYSTPPLDLPLLWIWPGNKVAFVVLGDRPRSKMSSVSTINCTCNRWSFSGFLNLLSSCKTGAIPGIRSSKMHLPGWVRCQKATRGVNYTKKWRAATIQTGSGQFHIPTWNRYLQTPLLAEWFVVIGGDRDFHMYSPWYLTPWMWTSKVGKSS